MTVDRAFLDRLLKAAQASVDPELLVRERLGRRGNILEIDRDAFDLERFRRIHVLGAGKAVPFLFAGVRKILGERIFGGLVVSLPEHAFADDRVAFMPGSHPIPDRSSLDAGKAMLRYVEREVGSGDMVLFLVTGGASALLAYPLPGVTLAEKAAVTRRLVLAGAGIGEVNLVRKALSRIKGGRLADRMRPASVVTLIVSDVAGSTPADIGSGPTIPQKPDPAAALRIMEKYGAAGRILEKVGGSLAGGNDSRGKRPPHSSPSRVYILGDNRRMLEAAAAFARRRLRSVHILTDSDRGEARQAAGKYGLLIRRIMKSGRPFRPPTMLLAGGELTVSVRGRGRGGRNQEFVLALLRELGDSSRPFFAASIASDGIDGPTAAAGAWIDQSSMSIALHRGLRIEPFLERNDSHRFFAELGQLVVTGPTRTNVMDLRLFYIG